MNIRDIVNFTELEFVVETVGRYKRVAWSTPLWDNAEIYRCSRINRVWCKLCKKVMEAGELFVQIPTTHGCIIACTNSPACLDRFYAEMYKSAVD